MPQNNQINSMAHPPKMEISLVSYLLLNKNSPLSSSTKITLVFRNATSLISKLTNSKTLKIPHI